MVSIIVPIYNVEQYLKPCLDSILASTFQDFELILVDDGSTDGSGALCDDYSQKDMRVIVIHKQNGGLSDARNAGLEKAEGDYVLFIDGDDVIHPQMIQVLYDAVNGGDYDLSMVYGIKVKDGEYTELMAQEITADTHSFEISQDEFQKRIFNISSFQYQVVWNKLYRKSLILGMTFLDVISEDVEWNNRVCLRVNKAVVIEADLYFYLQRTGSIMHGGVSEKSVGRIGTYLYCLDAIPKNMLEYRARCLKTMYSVMFLIRFHARNTEFAQLAGTYCRKVYQHTKNELFNSKHIQMTKKMRIVCNYHFPWLYNFLMDIILKRSKRISSVH